MDYMTIEDLEEQAARKNITAEQLDILASKTREMSAIRGHDLKRLKDLLAKIDKELKRDF